MKPLKSGRAKTYSRPLASKSGGAFAFPALQLVSLLVSPPKPSRLLQVSHTTPLETFVKFRRQLFELFR